MLFNNFGKLPLTLEKIERKFKLTKSVDTLSSKNKRQFEKPDERLHKKLVDKIEKLKTFEKVLTLLKND